MRKKYYTYNPKKDLFTEVKPRYGRKILKSLALFFSFIITVFAVNLIWTRYYPSPNEKILTKKLEQLKDRYASMQDNVEELTAVIDNVMERDAQVYNLLLGTKPVNEHIWNGGIGGHDLAGDKISERVSLKALDNMLDDVERKLVLHSKYLDDVERQASEKDERLNHIPSIRPIKMEQSDTYLRLLSGYGMRMHPVHKVRRMHKGLDFPAPMKTPVVATGEGKVMKIKSSASGYGRCVVIDHGFGYQTLYAHLEKVLVKKGDQISRGQRIGTVGRTGTATAPHVHYEVRYNDRAINPISYCMDGLNPDEYQRLVEAASKQNHSFD